MRELPGSSAAQAGGFSDRGRVLSFARDHITERAACPKRKAVAAHVRGTGVGRSSKPDLSTAIAAAQRTALHEPARERLGST